MQTSHEASDRWIWRPAAQALCDFAGVVLLLAAGVLCHLVTWRLAARAWQWLDPSLPEVLFGFAALVIGASIVRCWRAICADCRRIDASRERPRLAVVRARRRA